MKTGTGYRLLWDHVLFATIVIGLADFCISTLILESSTLFRDKRVRLLAFRHQAL